MGHPKIAKMSMWPDWIQEVFFCAKKSSRSRPSSVNFSQNLHWFCFSFAEIRLQRKLLLLGSAIYFTIIYVSLSMTKYTFVNIDFILIKSYNNILVIVVYFMYSYLNYSILWRDYFEKIMHACFLLSRYWLRYTEFTYLLTRP